MRYLTWELLTDDTFSGRGAWIQIDENWSHHKQKGKSFCLWSIIQLFLRVIRFPRYQRKCLQQSKPDQTVEFSWSGASLEMSTPSESHVASSFLCLSQSSRYSGIQNGQILRRRWTTTDDHNNNDWWLVFFFHDLAIQDGYPKMNICLTRTGASMSVYQVKFEVNLDLKLYSELLATRSEMEVTLHFWLGWSVNPRWLI